MTDPANIKRFYRPDEVAALLVISLRTVYRYIEEGRIPAQRIGGLWRIPKGELDRLYPAITSSERA